MRCARILPHRAASGGAALAALLMVLVPAMPADPARPAVPAAFGVGAPALASAGCPAGTSLPAGERITDEPWAQRRYGSQRLAGIADGADITVAVLDSGVDASHPQLRGAVLRGHDFLPGSAGGDGRTDCVAHGTAVASLIAAAPLPGTAFAGLAPGAKILPIRVTESGDTRSAGRAGTADGLARAIEAAVHDGARVLNISMVLYEDDVRVRDAVRDAIQAGAVVVAAVGNGHTGTGGADPAPYPAAYPDVIGVGAIGADGHRLAGSQVGSYVDIVAPGDRVTAAVPGSGLCYLSGTSFAAPFVSATAALILSRYPRPRASGAQVARGVAARITGTADPAPDTPRSGSYGYGVLNPYRAVTEVAAATKPPIQPEPVAGVQRVAAPDTGVRGEALLISAGALGATAVVLISGSVLARGIRRRWRPGRV